MTSAWLNREDSPNALNAYYIYRDETGLYFETAKAFDHIQIQPDGTVSTGTDYPSEVTF